MPSDRLTSAFYSTGEQFEYAYDAVGNRAAMTSVTPLSGTLVTTYTFGAANRLTDRAVSDGRTYTYDWSARGQMLAEWTQGYPVRTFTYDGAGRLVEATVFTLTTRFTYNGLGARVAVEVVGQGTTTYTLDYAASDRILAEQTITGTTLYLYGEDCLGEQRDGEWLYYHNDATGLVRQGTDEQGEVVSGWLFDPDGTVLEGPEGPVSHLVCGGVYDWSTGLIYKDGRYFDPMLGIWLALLPLVVVQSWRGRKKKWRGFPWYVVVLFVVGVGGTLTACGPGGTPTSEEIEATLVCTEMPAADEAFVDYWEGKENDGYSCFDTAFYVSYLVHQQAFDQAGLALEYTEKIVEQPPLNDEGIPETYFDKTMGHDAETVLGRRRYEASAPTKGAVVFFYWQPSDEWKDEVEWWEESWRELVLFHAAVVWEVEGPILFEKIGTDEKYQTASLDNVKARWSNEVRNNLIIKYWSP